MIDLNLILEALDMTNDHLRFFYDRQAGSTISVSENDWDRALADAIDADTEGRYVPLPTRREIDEYGMMKAFAGLLPEGEARRTLERALSGRGAFRRFREAVADFGLTPRWHDFRTAACHRLALEWCAANGVDCGTRPGAAEPRAAGVPDDIAPRCNPAESGTDATTTVADLKRAVRDMCVFRDWGDERAVQDPQKMAMAMVVELGELMEHFAWLDGEQLRRLRAGELPHRRAHIAEELADILIYAVQLARGLDIDISQAMLNKIEIVKGRRDNPDLGRSHPHVDSDG